jgi:hypothetical protein
VVGADDAAIPEPVLDAWQRAEASWDDPAHHDALFRAAAQHNCFAWAAGRYKTRAGDPIASVRLAKLRRAAEAALLATATVRPSADNRHLRSIFILVASLALAVALALVLAYVIRGKHHAADASDGRVVPAQPAAH